jgi:D-alanyl-D-alanine carboxypeptidase
MENAQEYGFVMSYPKGAEKETGYRYEPWHWRYVTTEDRAP